MFVIIQFLLKVKSKEQIRSEKIDRLLTHKYLGIPIFILDYVVDLLFDILTYRCTFARS